MQPDYYLNICFSKTFYIQHFCTDTSWSKRMVTDGYWYILVKIYSSTSKMTGCCVRLALSLVKGTRVSKCYTGAEIFISSTLSLVRDKNKLFCTIHMKYTAVLGKI